MTSTVTDYSELIDVTYPVAGVDNDTQGFRDNFSNIKNALNVADAEISDVQLKVNKLIPLSDLTGIDNIFAGKVIVASSSTKTPILYLSTGSIYASDDNLIIDGPKVVTIKSNNTSTGTIISISNIGVWPKDNTITLNSGAISTSLLGATFKFWSTATTTYVVTKVDASTNSITTSPFNSTELSNNGVTLGTVLTFYKPGDGTFAGTFVGNLTGDTSGTHYGNVIGTLVGSVENLKIVSKTGDTTTATLTASNRTLILSGIDAVTIQSATTSTATYIGFSGSPVGGNSYVRTVYVNTTTDLQVGSTFKYNDSSTSTFTVLAIDTSTVNQYSSPSINVSSINPSEFNNWSANQILTFTKGQLLGSVSWGTRIPATSKGIAGDKKGTIISNGPNLFVCYRDYTDGTLDIWSRINTVGTTW
jgi:hypothetical protein